MNEEQAKRYLFIHIPALVQCHPNTVWAVLFKNDLGEYAITHNYRDDCSFLNTDHDERVELSKIEIPYDENGELALEAEFQHNTSSEIHRQKYVGFIDAANEREFHSYDSDYPIMTPIYPKTKPEMVPWSDEELLGAKCRENDGDYVSIVITIQGNNLTVGLGDEMGKGYFLENYVQLNGEKFEKEAT